MLQNLDKIPVHSNPPDDEENNMGNMNVKKTKKIWMVRRVQVGPNASVGKIAFGQVKNVKHADFPEGNCKIAWDRLVSNYALHTASSCLT